MAQCDICGKSVESLQTAIVEGVSMKVCSNCAPLGRKPPEPIRLKQKRKYGFEDTEELIATNAHSLLKAAREKRGMNQKEFAQLIGVRESVLHQFESGHTQPSLDEAKKIEKLAHVKLIVKDTSDDYEVAPKSIASKGFTLGDMIKIKKK